MDESSVTIKPVKWGSQLEKRRKKRRRRRAGLDPEEEENVVPEVETEPKAVSVHVGASRSGFLSRLEEVQLCFYLKVYSSNIYGKFSNVLVSPLSHCLCNKTGRSNT